MRSARFIFKNIFILFGKRLIDFIFLFIFNIYIARTLGVTEFGKFGFALAFTTLFIGFCDFGLSQYLNREVAKDRSCLEGIIGKILLIKFLLLICCLIIIFFVINFLRYEAQTRAVVYIVGLAMVIYSYQLVFLGIFRGSQRMDLEFITSIFEKPMLLISTYLLFQLDLGILGIAYLLVFSRLFTLCLEVFFYLKNYGKITFRVEEPAQYWSLLKKSFPYGTFLILGILYFNIDTVILSYLHGEDAVGIYQSAIKLVMFLMIFPEAITESIFPRMTEYFYKSKEELKLLYNRTIKLLAFFSFPILAIFIFLNNFIMQITFGKQYSQSAVILPFFGWLILFRFLASGAGSLLTATKLQKNRTITVLIATILTILLNIVLIPRFSYIGASFSALLVNLFLFLYYSFILSRQLSVRINIRDLFKFFISFIAMSAFLVISGVLNIYLRIFIAMSIFVFSTWHLKVLSREDLAILRNVLSAK
jgi:O-antigen/teichoic acid export membrane protein